VASFIFARTISRAIGSHTLFRTRLFNRTRARVTHAYERRKCDYADGTYTHTHIRANTHRGHFPRSRENEGDIWDCLSLL